MYAVLNKHRSFILSLVFCNFISLLDLFIEYVVKLNAWSKGNNWKIKQEQIFYDYHDCVSYFFLNKLLYESLFFRISALVSRLCLTMPKFTTTTPTSWRTAAATRRPFTTTALRSGPPLKSVTSVCGFFKNYCTSLFNLNPDRPLCRCNLAKMKSALFNFGMKQLPVLVSGLVS